MLTVAETAKLLKSFDRVLILTHIRPDGDTVGSAAALCVALRNLGKSAYVLSNPGFSRFTAPYVAPYIAPDGFIPKQVIAVDTAAENMFTENAAPYIGKIDLAIDHHPSFECFGRAYIVRSSASACGELLYDILSRLGTITPEIALPLYLAISTDTGCFSYTNTTAYTHSVVAALMNTGIDYKKINKTFFRTKTRTRLRLEAAMLNGATFYDENRIVIMSIPISLMERMNATESDAEDLSALGGQIEGVDCSVTMRELETDVWKISLRTGERVNATKVCTMFGGGGHAAASGCIIRSRFYDARAQILKAIEDVISSS